MERLVIIWSQLSRIEDAQYLIIKKLNEMANEISNLAAAVAQMTTVEQSAAALLTQLSILIKNAANSGDLKQVQDLADQINTQSTALAAAVTANTPATTPPPPVLTPKTYTDAAGDTIVVTQAGDTPVSGEAVTVNGAAIATETNYDLTNGASILVGADSKVISYAPVASGGTSTGK